jgi:GNAT superfamily N-acetyltransferase
VRIRMIPPPGAKSTGRLGSIMCADNVLSKEHGGLQTTPRIRRFEVSDSISDLTQLLHRAYARLAQMGMDYLAAHQDEAVTRRRLEGGECWVAELDREIVGTILLHGPRPDQAKPRYSSRWYGRPGVAWFCQFAVDPSVQGRGIGALLMEAVEKRALDCGALELACDTAIQAKSLIEMYVRWGFRRVDMISWPNTGYYSVVLSKPLGQADRKPSRWAPYRSWPRFAWRAFATMGIWRPDGRRRWCFRVAGPLISWVRGKLTPGKGR